MGEGVSFYKGGSEGDVKNPSYSVVPDQPKTETGGPLVESAGAQPESHSFSKTSPSWDATGEVPRGGKMQSPTDV